MSIKLITENICISIYFICSIYSLYIFFNLKVLMDHPIKKKLLVYGEVVYEDQRMISWSLSTYVGSRDGTQITGLARQASLLVEPYPWPQVTSKR